MIRPLLLLFLIFLSLGKLSGQIRNWTLLNDYLPVYTFSEQTEGLTIELQYGPPSENSIIDSVFEKLTETDSLAYVFAYKVKNCIPIDTNGKFKFYKNLKLEENLLRGINKSFFVYCKNGIVERKIKDVVFSADECISNIVVFRFDKIDTTKFGPPLFCTKEKLLLHFGNFKTESNEITSEKINSDEEYKDSVKAIVYAKMDSLYFEYEDTFNWNDFAVEKNYSFFPARSIIVKRANGKLYWKWSRDLDLIGVPCD